MVVGIKLHLAGARDLRRIVPTILSLDPATHTGCAIGEPGSKPRLTSITLRDSKDDTREDVFGRATRWMAQAIERHHPVLLAIEEPFYMVGKSNYDTTVLLHGLYAVFVGLARANNIKVWPVSSSTWRKHTLGSARQGGRAKSKEAMLMVCKKLGWAVPDDNAADAAGIWIWATAKYAPYGVIPVEPLFLEAKLR